MSEGPVPTPLGPVLLAASREAEQMGLRTLSEHLRGIADALGSSTYGGAETFSERDAEQLATLLRGVLLVLADPPRLAEARDRIRELSGQLRNAIRIADRLAHPARVGG